MEQNAQKPTVGRIVHYVMPDHHDQARGEIRPAIVVRVWPDGGHGHQLVQLQVFTDCTNDGPGCASGLLWATSVRHDQEEKQPGTWHWPTRS